MSTLVRLGENRTGRDFVVGDVHGEFPALETLLERVRFDPGRDRLLALGDLINRGPHSVRALAWMDQGRIALSVRGNHEETLLRYLEMATGATTPRIVQHLCGWFLREVPRERWHEWITMIRTMPIAATVMTAHGPVGLVHASPTARHWDTTLERLRAGHRDTEWAAMWSNARARGNLEQARYEDIPAEGPILGVRAVMTGHYIVGEPRAVDNVWHLDTGAGVPGGRLTLARIDTDPIETMTGEGKGRHEGSTGRGDNPRSPTDNRLPATGGN